MFEVIESLAGMVGTMLEYPMMGMLSRMIPSSGSEAGQQVATAVGTGLDNLGTLCSQAGLDRWELLGLAVLSALTVYRKELSSNSVYHGKQSGGNHGNDEKGSLGFQHAEGCPGADGTTNTTGSARPCACIEGAQRAAAAAVAAATAASVSASTVDQRRLRRLVEGRMRALNLPVGHLQQLRASIDASWSSFAAAWEARRGAKVAPHGKEGAVGKRPTTPSEMMAASVDFVMPPCAHAPYASQVGLQKKGGKGCVQRNSAECMECAALKAAHAAAASILRNEDGSAGRTDTTAWEASAFGALPSVSFQKALSFLEPKDLLTMAQVSRDAREVADDDWVWREAWLARFGTLWGSEKCQLAALRWHLHDWNPTSSPVLQGWKSFFSEFEATWLEWVAAGHNSEASCMVGLYGRLYDITEFMHRHPGSPETLMDNAGADATHLFEDVGHSANARELMASLEYLAPTSPPVLPSRPSLRNTSSALRFRDSRCILSSTVERLRFERINAGVTARTVDAKNVAIAEGVAGARSPQTREASAEDIDSRGAFRCHACGESFDPMGKNKDGESEALRSTCLHANGTLRIFRIPTRGEWAGFYSCCRKHVLLSAVA